MNPAHHLNRSQRYLNFVPRNVAAGDYDRAAKALARSASHAVTAAAVHWRNRHHSRRRLTTALTELVFERRIAHTHLRTFKEVYALLDEIPVAAAATARKLLCRLRRRVSRLSAAIATAVAAQPEVPTLDQLMAQSVPPEPVPLVNTMGELRAALGKYIDTAHESHPWDCYGCRINYHGPNLTTTAPTLTSPRT